jgi:hypothetical protein
LTEVACSDDACGAGLQSSITLNNHDYPNLDAALLRRGNFPGSGQGTGQVELLSGDPDCPGYTEDALEASYLNGSELCANANVLAAGNYPALTVHKADDDWYEIPLQDLEILTADVLFIHANGDIDIQLVDACGGTQIGLSQSIDDNEQIVWQNTSGGPLSVWLQVYVWSGSASNCADYEMNLDISPGTIGSKYCAANANSTGSPADISASGSTSSGAGDLTLEASPVPNQTGIFFHGNNAIQVTFGNRFNCVSGGLKSGSPISGTANLASYTYDNSDNKHDLSAHIGSTRRLQFWYRDPMGGGSQFNTSNAIAIDILS